MRHRPTLAACLARMACLARLACLACLACPAAGAPSAALAADPRAWKVESVLLRHADSKNHAFQYVDWLFEGDDIIAVSRTAWDGSHRAHDANYLTFHRVPDFRRRTPQDPPLP